MSWFDDNDPAVRSLDQTAVAPAGTGAGIPWAPGASQPSSAPAGYTWSVDQARFIPTTGTAATGGGPPTLNRNDPASVAAYVQYYSTQPGANPSLARDPNYWIQKISSGELGDDPGYIVSKFMLPEGAPAGQAGGSLGSLGQGFGGLVEPFTGQFSYSPFKAPTAADAEAQPGYQFARDQGLQAIDRSAAAKGTLLTGGNLKDLASYAGGVASTNYNNVWNQAFQANNSAYNQGLGAFQTNRDTFYHNQDSPYQKYYGLASLGRPTTP